MNLRSSLSLLFASFLLLGNTIAEAKPNMMDLSSDEDKQIIVNNRILAKVNGNPISVIDVMKKMDMVFYREFPEYTSSKAARYQFYLVNWKSVFHDLINKELIMADADENKLVINNGDVRQEMESIFGPNIIANLDKIGMTLDEAWKIVKGDITLRRMMMIRVNSKAIRQVGPQEIRTAYESYSKANVKSDEWQYYVISIRDKDAIIGGEVASRIEELVKENPSSTFEELSSKIKDWDDLDKSTTINISDEFVHNDLQISPAYKGILSTLSPGTFSESVSQRSRADNKMIYRIFYLKNKVPGGVVDFAEVELKIKDKLLDEAIGKETDLYLKKLHKHFGVSENLGKEIAEDFKPFALQ